MNRKTIFIIFTISFILSICLGMMDHETESLIHLFTNDPGNLITLLLFTIFLGAFGIILTLTVKAFMKMQNE